MASITASPNSTEGSPRILEQPTSDTESVGERRRQFLFLQFCRIGVTNPLPIIDAAEGAFIDRLRDFNDKRPELVGCIARLLDTKQQKATRPDYPFLEKVMSATDLKLRWRRFLIERLSDRRTDPSSLKAMFLDDLASQTNIEPGSAEADVFSLERAFARVAAMPDTVTSTRSSEPTFVAAPHEVVQTNHPIGNYIEARDRSCEGNGRFVVIFKTSTHSVPAAMVFSSAVSVLLTSCKSPRTISHLTKVFADGRFISKDRLTEALRNALSKLLSIGLIRTLT